MSHAELPHFLNIPNDEFSLFDCKEEIAVDVRQTEIFGQSVPSGRIFVRSCYLKLFPMLWGLFAESRNAISLSLSGTPGVGKSLFGLLFLRELIAFLKTHAASSSHSTLFGQGLSGRVVYELVNAAEDRYATYRGRHRVRHSQHPGALGVRPAHLPHQRWSLRFLPRQVLRAVDIVATSLLVVFEERGFAAWTASLVRPSVGRTRADQLYAGRLRPSELVLSSA